MEMKDLRPITNWTRLFLVSEDDAEFLHGVVHWRIMWRGGKHRVILRERMTYQKNWLQNFPQGCSLDALAGDCMDPAARDQGIWLFRFANCTINRSWIPDAGALSSDEMAPLDYWLEINCQILTFMEDLE